MKINEEIVNRLNTAFASTGWSKAELGKIVKLSGKHCALVLRGKRDMPENFIHLFCDRAKISEQWLMTGEGEMLLPVCAEGMAATPPTPRNPAGTHLAYVRTEVPDRRTVKKSLINDSRWSVPVGDDRS